MPKHYHSDTSVHLPALNDIPRDKQIDSLIYPYVYSLGGFLKDREARRYVPGAAVVVRKNSEIVHLNCYGYANLETREKITPTTIFDLGSLSKQFTAMAALALVRSKQISLEDKLSKFFSGFPRYADSITVQDLIHHTSGLPDYIDLHVASREADENWYRLAMSEADDWYPRMQKRKKKEKTNTDVVNWIGSQKILATTPGEDFEYSNSGYVILAQIVAEVTGMRFADFLKQGIFDAVGMTDTFLFDESSRFSKKAPQVVNHARCYNRTSEGFIPVGYTPLNFIYGDGNIHSTIVDLAKWDLRLEQLEHASICAEDKKEQHEAKRIREMLWSPVREPGRRQVNYGAGWNLLRDTFHYEWDAGGKHFNQHFEMIAEYHRGEWLGWRSYIARASRWIIPKKGKSIDPESWDSLGIVVLANSGQFNACAAVQKISQNYWGDLKKVNIMNRFNCGGKWNRRLRFGKFV